MTPVTIGRLAFSQKHEFPALIDSTIVSCAVMANNLSAKVLNEKKVAVFGDYDILICYHSKYNSQKDKFQAESIRKAFCETIPCDVSIRSGEGIKQQVEVMVEYASKPVCKHIPPDFFNTFHQIEISGEIIVELISHWEENSCHDGEGDGEQSKVQTPASQLEEEKENIINTAAETPEAAGSDFAEPSVAYPEKAPCGCAKGPVKVSIYQNENGQFVCQYVSRHNSAAAEDISKEKPERPAKKEIKRPLAPVQSWQYEVDTNLSPAELLEIELATLQKKTRFRNPMTQYDIEENEEQPLAETVEKGEEATSLPAEP